MLLAGIATHFNSRASVARQTAEAAANPQTALMNKLALYVFPLGVVVGGPFLPLAVIMYWLANNIWTYGQQHYVFNKIEKEEEAKKAEALERRAANAPAPGAKPKRARRAQDTADAVGDETTDAAVTDAASAGGTDGVASGPAAKAAGNGAAPKPSSGQTANRTPRPGARPKKRKR